MVIAAGQEPFIPGNCDVGDKAFHSIEFLHRIHFAFPDRDSTYRFAVAGMGQSAAEITEYLLTSYPKSKVTVIGRSATFHGLDDNPFVNRLYGPSSQAWFHRIGLDKRRVILRDLMRSNYGAVDGRLLRNIFEINYLRQVSDLPPLEVLELTELDAVDVNRQTISLTVRDLTTGSCSDLETDCVVYATGFKPANVLRFLTKFPYKKTEDGRIMMNRQYQVCMHPTDSVSIFTQGYFEDIHGVSEGTLTALAERARAILGTIIATKTATTKEIV